MKLAGLQKLSLLDFPGITCCTVFTPGCNFRCPFCHNAPLVLGSDEPLIPEEDFFAYLNKRKNVLQGVCVSGGEPLLQPDIEPFLIKIRALGYAVKLDTNGSFPEKLESLCRKGLLDYVAMDIKSSEEGYLKTIGLKEFDLDKIRRSVAFLKEGMVPYEFRTTVVKELHGEREMKAIAVWLSGSRRYTLQAFVNSENVIDNALSAPSKEEIAAFAALFTDKVEEITTK